MATTVAAYCQTQPMAARLVSIQAIRSFACSTVGFLGGAAAMSLVGGLLGAAGSIMPKAHFLFVRACGYRLTVEERFPAPAE